MTMDPGRKTSPIVGVVYAARLYGSGEFRYVGITSRTVEFRRRQHIKAARGGRKTPFYDWLRKMESDEDVYFQPVELITNGSLEDLGEAEQRWIAKLRRKGHGLLNLTEGGLGPRGYVWTEEQRRAAGERSRGQAGECSDRARSSKLGHHALGRAEGALVAHAEGHELRGRKPQLRQVRGRASELWAPDVRRSAAAAVRDAAR